MTTNDTPIEQEHWDNWVKYRSNDAANELIVNYMYLVNFHVERISSNLPKSVNKDDVKSLGLLGLYDALKKFDPSRDLKFDTYASFRIKGAILDGLRKLDWLPRSLREKTKKVNQVSIELEQALKRQPSSKEIAEQMGISSREVESIVSDSLYANVLSIEEKPKNNAEELKEGIGYSIPDEATLPEMQLLQGELKDELVMGIKALNKNEQMVVSLFYYDELTFTEIGQILGLTTSRISQIHKKSIFKLKNTLTKIQKSS
ncbi:FliA/WhiG family RNA polymerase sigma factor [Oceanobacillus chungangensis]|uniref:FliA/WhiG family RNA polymerase sigma factor n=1 Tax=Oceanobacillus chungangensis TaxID=1229152 RepID=A0A3D8PNY1_9BACI|nr:FliA/WhiG family RNA polymerase sigma factor [Oceanobacillus chungangensis]RDW17813.1 FliA/WhiG family RNA polymerase sigma factor [Oceanobacillus chungangensis]